MRTVVGNVQVANIGWQEVIGWDCDLHYFGVSVLDMGADDIILYMVNILHEVRMKRVF